MAVPAHSEMHASPTESHNGLQFKAQRKLRCAWTDRHDLVTELLGFGGADYPHKPLSGITATSASIMPVLGEQKGSDQLTLYDEAFVTINYGSPETDDPVIVPGVGAVSMSLEPSVEFMTLDHEDFRWDSDTGDALNSSEAPGRRIEGMDLVYSLHRLSSLPIAILDLIETSNGNPINAILLGLLFPVETLLFSSPSIDRRTNSAGTAELTARFSFSFRKTGWNRHWRVDKPGGPGWSKLYTKKNGETPGVEYKNFPPTDWSGVIS